MNANARENTAHLPATDRAWIADWRAFNAVHFSVPAETLAPHVPYPLDCHEGRAWVSLVWFELYRLRFAGGSGVGRLLCRPISDHPFLNVRTYVRGASGTGICFLAEWIPNRVNCALGPILYGLPYRFGRFAERNNRTDGTASLRIDDPKFGASFALNVPTRRADARPCATGSIDEFLLERYQAYTFHGETGCRFRVAHVRWEPVRTDWVRCDLGFLRDAFPWISAATLELAHVCGDLCDVEMGFPHRVELGTTRETVGRALGPDSLPETQAVGV